MSWKKILLEGDAAVLSDTVPNTIAPSDTASAGVATEASRQDHEHGAPATWPPSAHLLGAHTTDTLANLNAIVTDATLDDSSSSRTPSAHLLGSHTTDTLANLNAKVTDATLDDSSDSRTPSAHLLDSHTAPTSAVDFNKQQATSLALDVQASAPGTPVDGQVYYNSTDDHPYVYVA